MRQFEDSGRGQETAITDFEQALEAARTRVHHSSEARVAAEIEQRAQAQKLGDEQSKVYEAEAALARQEQSLQHARELQQLKVRELDQINRQLGEFDAREQRERQRLEEAARQLTELEQQALSAEEHGTATQSTLIERSEEHTSELQSLMRISYAVFCLKKK